ncbi:hypothetical protein BDB00DRAFT_814002 [Zychaea mexicana]|uniref:uncharacterized protein n=1 Tax=Zychaea mexicana TaxID=64656 RepID=UPI0022FE8F65|nr:uncharacterized protein BDB00DRAFT_814002 [Zychaea mexicana]KAI9495288.1 hypothetical protein BDB00DRAFT_814002 [Zychaea mexicana]
MVTETCEYTGAWKNPDQRVTITSLPMYHAAGLNRSVTTGVTTGYIQVVLEKYTVENLCAAIERFKINDVPTAPPILLHLLNHPAVAKYDLSTLKSLNVGSAPVSPQVVRDIMKKFNAVCTQAYGMTEISPIGTMQTKETCVPESVGRLLPCMEGKVIDPEGQDLPWGSVGEICFRGPTVMIGYLDDPESTDATIDKDGWIRTGDQGFVDKDGNWFIQDRLKELIKYKGFQVAPAELEALLLQCPLVLDAAVIGVYNEQQATEFPRAYVVLRPEAVNDKDAPQKIVQWTHDRVAQHKRLRGGVKVVNEIPKSPTGKILRRTVRDMARKEDASVHIGAASKL